MYSGACPIDAGLASLLRAGRFCVALASSFSVLLGRSGMLVMPVLQNKYPLKIKRLRFENNGGSSRCFAQIISSACFVKKCKTASHSYRRLQPASASACSALTGRGHQLVSRFDISDSVTEEAVALFSQADRLAPFLKRALQRQSGPATVCLIVLPACRTRSRGPSALDWAIQRGVDNRASPYCRPEAGWMPGRSGRRRWSDGDAPRHRCIAHQVTRSRHCRPVLRGRLRQSDDFVPPCARAGARNSCGRAIAISTGKRTATP